MGLMLKSVEALIGRIGWKGAEIRHSCAPIRASIIGLNGLQVLPPALHLPPRSYQRSGVGPQKFESVGGEA